MRDPAGDNETIMSGQSSQKNTNAVGTNRYRFVTKENVANDINISEGDLVRLNVQVWTTLRPAAGAGTVWLFHDPLATEPSLDDVTTDLKCTIPLALEL